eukprot:TRINITY_DN10170_c0_g1_i1.p1 TRINITY_DN10170_c0_g1~~TRINITY_DN10170_c0_g1_i1.p1  ORF type:complete len:185 (+),score=16.87 TRINITY_DN10170_c0_g1_i1:67-621(+)
MGRKKSAASSGLKKCGSFVSSSSGSAFGEFGVYNQVTCSICLEKYTSLNPAMTYQCGHAYHLQCAESWRQRNGTCPMCWEPLDEAALYTGTPIRRRRSDSSLVCDDDEQSDTSAPTKQAESISSHEPLVPIGTTRTRSICSMDTSDTNSTLSSDQPCYSKCFVGRLCRDCLPKLYTKLFDSNDH